MAKTSGIVSIHGKDYATVAFRLQCFRELHPNGHIITTLESDDGTTIVMKCLIYFSEYEMPVASGWAEEVRGSSNINKTSALENCETSAVGRALGFVGFGSAESIASADEVAIAIERQKTEAAEARATLDKMAKRSEAKATKKQRESIEQFLDECTDGDLKLKAILDWAGIDNLSELTKDQAKATLERIKGLDVIA
jgi:hypothetical protein